MYFLSECSQTIVATQGVITSPVYLNGTGDLACTYNVTMIGNTDVAVLSFMKSFCLPNGTLNVTFWNTIQNSTASLTGKIMLLSKKENVTHSSR